MLLNEKESSYRMNIENNTPVGKIAAKYPLATRVFARYKIDFCCGGGVALEVVCQKKNLDTQVVIDALNSEINEAKTASDSWEDRSAKALIEHILATFHRPLDEELPRLAMMANKVHSVHGEKDGALGDLAAVVNALKSELESHMAKEEEILFPAILRGDDVQADGPISEMLQEHDDAGDALKKIRSLTNDFTLRPDACNTWRALWHGLEALESDMHQHIHLENNILFPNAYQRG